MKRTPGSAEEDRGQDTRAKSVRLGQGLPGTQLPEGGRQSPVPDSVKQLPPRTGEPSGGGSEQIIELLEREGLVTAEQLGYARRIRSKLPSPRTLLKVLQDLHMVTQEQIRETLRASRVSIRLGSLLVELGRLREADLRTALALQEERPGMKLGQLLLEGHFLEEEDLIEVLSYQLGFESLSPGAQPLEPELMRLAPIRWFRSNDCVPVGRRDGTVVVALADPMDRIQVDAVRKLFGENTSIGIARREEIREALDRWENLRTQGSSAAASENLVVQTVNEIIVEAAEANASDIHLEPLRDRLQVRFRKDGVLLTHKNLPLDMVPSLVSRIKIMAAADIAEKRRHQDGRILFDLRGTSLDIRVSTYSTIHGETIVMRLLNNRSQLLDVRDIGMAPRVLERYLEDALEAPSGVIIITGPTGSGKTTTLYASIQHLNNPHTSIITAEDPVEYVIDGISQCSINPKINVTYEDTLKHIVRQDPDVIVIGEIRDVFSAETAIQAALTGHKVLTTFHTEDSIGGLIRLLNMNIEAFLISSTVVSVVAQRLLRRVCSHCAEDRPLTAQQARRLGYEPKDLQGITFKAGRGCRRCRYQGYNGRAAIFELLVLNELVRDAIIARKTSYEIRRLSTETTGLVTLLEDGIYKAYRGVTSYDEIARQLPRLSKPRPLSELRRHLGEEG